MENAMIGVCCYESLLKLVTVVIRHSLAGLAYAIAIKPQSLPYSPYLPIVGLTTPQGIPQLLTGT